MHETLRRSVAEGSISTLATVENLQKEMREMKVKIALMEGSEVDDSEKLKAGALIDEVHERLKADITQETARATQAEQALQRISGAQADSIDDVTTFIASGCREDTLAYYRIKVRHLINLAQAKLAYSTGLSTTPGERNDKATYLWRQYCDTLVDERKDKWENTRVEQAKKFIREKRNEKDRTATDALMKSGALEILVNDWDLRSVSGGAAQHPDPLKKDEVDGYRLAIAAVGNEVEEQQLTGCVSYVFTVGGVPD
ncbi:hypothetical protein GALMADRAFT_246647, partial [Galerina marginata CBS 339.88]